jgi:hypothetical protein
VACFGVTLFTSSSPLFEYFLCERCRYVQFVVHQRLPCSNPSFPYLLHPLTPRNPVPPTFRTNHHLPYLKPSSPTSTSHSCSLAKFVMAEVDFNRKRSRSASDSDEKKHHKRANTGLAPSPDDSRAQKTQDSAQSSHPSMTHDVNMTEGPASIADTTASTPSPKPSSSDNKSGDSRTRSDEPNRLHATTSAVPSSSSSLPPPSAMIHMRCLIVTQDASIIIGKSGSHVNEIRDKSGARVMVSESIPGNPERILNVSGPLDAVSKAGIHLFSSSRPTHTFLARPLVSSYGESTTNLLMSLLFLEVAQSRSSS